MTDATATTQPPAAQEQDQVLTVRLPVSAWVVIGNHLRRGAYEDVAPIIAEIYRQTMGQLLPPADPRTSIDAATAAIRQHREQFDAAQAADAHSEAASLSSIPTPTTVN